MFNDWLIVASFPSIRRIWSITIQKQNPEGEHFHNKSLPGHEAVLEYLFSRIDIYLFIDQHSFGVLNWLCICSFIYSKLSLFR